MAGGRVRKRILFLRGQIKVINPVRIGLTPNRPRARRDKNRIDLRLDRRPIGRKYNIVPSRYGGRCVQR